MTEDIEFVRILGKLADEICVTNKDHGFHDDKPNKGEMIALMHSELSEALEAIRKPGPDSHCPDFTGEEIELADCIIRILHYSGRFGLRIGEAIIVKAEFNKSRPYKHGKAF